MRFGVCAGFAQLDIARESGCDYLEPPVTELMALSSEAFRETKKRVDDSKIKCEAFNVMLPGDLKVTGPDADLRKLATYMEEALGKMRTLGGRIVVFGSAGARSCPEGFEKSRALDQIVKFLDRLVPALEAHEIVLAIEPLNPGESNMINLVSEAGEVSALVNSHTVCCLADWYHMKLQNENTEGIWRAGERLVHVHIANPDGRVYPREGDGQEYTRLADALSEIGYRGRVSVEAKAEDIRAELPAAIAYMRSIYG